MLWNHGKAILEALLLAAPEPLTPARIAEVIGIEEREVRILVDDLRREYTQPGRGLMVREVAGGFQLVTRPELADYVERLLQPRGRGLSHAALETLAIIAYRQPVTKGQIEAVRGVNVDRLVDSLLERRLIKELGRKEAPGRPILYGTTRDFLTYFGLKSLADLPPVAPEEEGRSLLDRLPADAEMGEAEAATAEDGETGAEPAAGQEQP